MSLTKSHEEPLGLSLTDSLARIFDNSIDTDVTFLVGDEQVEVKAHKLILRSRSPVFRAMFDDSPIAESNTVTIPDTDKWTFQKFLRYFYVDELTDTFGFYNLDAVKRLLYLIEKYMMPMMKSICVSFLQNLLDLDTAFEIFNICTVYSLLEFRATVVKFMADQADECCRLETFTQQDHLLIEKFTESPHLCIAETKLLDAVLRWATNECNRKSLELNSENIRLVLGQIIRNVRFMSIPESELQGRLLFDGVLTRDEVKELERLYNADTANMKSEIFEVMPRNGLSNEIITRYKQSTSESTSEKQYALNLTTSGEVWLFGVSVYGPTQDHGFVCVVIEVKTYGLDDSKVIRHLKKTDFSEKVAHIMFDKPIRLKPKAQYTLLLTIFGSGSYQSFYVSTNGLATSVNFHGTTLSFSNEVGKKFDLYTGRGQFPRFFLQGMNEAYASYKYKAKKRNITHLFQTPLLQTQYLR